jgi:hypothetical protein
VFWVCALGGEALGAALALMLGDAGSDGRAIGSGMALASRAAVAVTTLSVSLAASFSLSMS